MVQHFSNEANSIIRLIDKNEFELVIELLNDYVNNVEKSLLLFYYYLETKDILLAAECMNNLHLSRNTLSPMQSIIYEILQSRYLIETNKLMESFEILENIDETQLSPRWIAYRYHLLFLSLKDPNQPNQYDYLIDEAINICNTSDLAYLKLKFLNIFAQHYLTYKDIRCLSMHLEIINQSKKLGLNVDLSLIYYNYANSLENFSNFDEAELMIQESLKYTISNKIENKAVILSKYAMILFKMEKYNESRKYNTQASELYLEINEMLSYSKTLDLESTFLVIDDEFEAAREILNESIKIQNSFESTSVSYSMIRLGLIHLYENNILDMEIGYDLLTKAIQIFINDGNIKGQRYVNNLIENHFIVMDSKDELIKLLVEIPNSRNLI
ncbi:MAG: hypothetical protein OEY49_09840 [Candidatus Heimdallarchaeota archaeon]|nr:hypothetical protein [Candidatus Heimdallarchaeota archaeon]